MKATDIIAALTLPAGAQVAQRVPKKLLVENGAPTALDKRQINDGIEEITWVAALKPTTIGVPEYRDLEREYLEIAVLAVTLRAGAKVTRLIELVHRAVPYPVFLVLTDDDCLSLSFAHKRWSQGEIGKTVLDGEIIEAGMDNIPDRVMLGNFLQALALARQPRTTLYTLYQGWIDTVLALQASRITGAFTSAMSTEHAASRRVALQACARLQAQISTLRAQAVKEKQINRRVDLNLAIKRLEVELAATTSTL